MQERSKITIFLFCAAAAFAAEKPAAQLPQGAVPAPMTLYNFDHEARGRLPSALTFPVTGAGADVHWEIREDPQAPSRPYVLAQTGGAGPGENFALAVLEAPSLEHGEVAVRFKAVGGEDAQTAGIVWRYQDTSNYYVVAASAREDNCCFYRVKGGKRKLLDEKAVVVAPYTWHELRIAFVGPHYTVSLDGETILGGKDKSFKDAGRVGLWTEASSSIRFDDLRVSK